MVRTLRKCHNVADLSGLIADFLNGRTKEEVLRTLFGFHGVDPRDLEAPLASGHFAITAASVGSHGRRAFVYGYATRDGLSALTPITREHPSLWVGRYQPGPNRPTGKGVSVIWDEAARTERRFHFKTPAQIHAKLPREASPTLATALVQATQVIVCDRSWESNDDLWPALQRVFTRA